MTDPAMIRRFLEYPMTNAGERHTVLAYIERLETEREYLAAMCAANDGARLGKERLEAKENWLIAAEKAWRAGWSDTYE